MLQFVIMPLLAYLTEPFPWEPDSRVDWNSICANFNVSKCNNIVLLQARHDSLTLAHGVAYGFWAAYDVHREVVELYSSESFLLKMPLYLFYSKEAHERTLALSAGIINASDFYAVTMSTYIGFPLAYTCTWALPTSSPSRIEAYLPLEFHIFKLLLRLDLSFIINRIVQRDYYRHYSHLERFLILFGLNGNDTIYYIVVGGPTSIVVLNPYMAFAFFMDFLMSLDFICRAVIRICQLDNYIVFFFATIYLSRTLWFTYGGLSLTSYIIKRLKFVRFHPINPTLIALAMTTFAGPLTYYQSRIDFFMDFYYILLNEVSTVPENTIEILHAGWLFMFSIILMPPCSTLDLSSLANSI
ncbi:hypothetical protein THRCLA_22432 [Thraustotheca clavata]|uniref:Transmembrane protein n=1 Tax=Thraustotheca clavata TaxID=74557 RepID=A0A1V9Z1H1_9STRA|nr:hypothetical protein THRCLA_22432 [Thraustotheca clavata]